jgi:glycosyltransferase involved in cell wall biosynthesis
MISVVVPVYNGEKFIRQAYAQIIAAADLLPSGEQVEILFVNDGSKDESAGILNALAASDPRVRHIQKENGGIASARNTGLEHASGEFVCFIDQDDVMKQDMLSVLYEDMKKQDADFVQANANTIRDGVESPVCSIRSNKVIESGTELYSRYLQTLVMRGLVHYPDCEVSGSIWCCMFRTEFLRENNIFFFSFCDYEDDWIFLILSMVNAGKFIIETRTVYSWLIHNQSESHNRTSKDRYLEDFYEKHRLLRAFFHEALKNVGLTEKMEERFACELQKQALLWSLSNETGRGIERHTEREIVDIMTHVVETETYEGICRHINRHPLYISVAGAHGWKRCYYVLRDKLLTFLLLHNQIPLAVRLNKNVFHGRWHM